MLVSKYRRARFNVRFIPTLLVRCNICHAAFKSTRSILKPGIQTRVKILWIRSKLV